MFDFAEQYLGKENILAIEDIPGGGSDRSYQRIITKEGSFILAENKHVEENECFFYFTNHFRTYHLPLPKLLAVNEDRTQYLLEDVGKEDLLHHVLNVGFTEEVKTLYKKSLAHLVIMQTKASADLDYSRCFSSSAFDAQSVLADLNYFKYYFLDMKKVPYNKRKLLDEFNQLSERIAIASPQGFMYRDFQGRNILIQTNEPHFIDYQGGMKGPLTYDVASLLWQAKANLPSEWKKELYQYYVTCLRKEIEVDEQQLEHSYSEILLVRLLQVLGAYGLKGLIEKRTHFIESISFGLQNISSWQEQFDLKDMPELSGILQFISSEQFKSEFKMMKAADDCPLQILVQSFSYKKGIPTDPSGNGGGFVFDCRGVFNPGRYEEYKKQTGRDKAVISFLEKKTKIHEFLNAAKEVVSINIDDYIERGFQHLQINFGCTGGQHRSVYCADQMASFIENKYGLKPIVFHIEQEAKGWKNG